jgi:MFS family permease
MFANLNKIYHEFPRRFWVVVAVSFIDRIGGTLLFPFFALYITQRFGVGMTQAGVVLGMFSVFSLLGGMFGGALTDRFGRRRLILFGLIFSALSTLSLGLVNDYALLLPVAAVIGLLADVAGPAHQAMIADILPEEKRQEGFGILRVVANISWIIGPVIGGFVADRSFFALFVIDAIISCIVAVLFYILIPETKPEPHPDAEHETLLQTFGGYRRALQDYSFVAFILASILMGLVYQQMYHTLSVYLRDVHGISPQGYGVLLTFSAVTVILFQFWTTRVIKTRPPFLMMALGVIFYAIGFGMFALVTLYLLFGAAIVVITIGEMIVMPTSSALAAHFAPEEMRGRYMAVFGLTYLVPSIFGPAAAGFILDNYNPNLVWVLGSILCVVSALCFYALHARLGRLERFAPAPPNGQTVPAGD